MHYFVKCAFEELYPTFEYCDNWHILYMCDLMQAIVEGRVPKKIIINIQPRSLKSFLCSVAFPCWVWLRDPSQSFLFLSYVQTLANDFSLLRRDLLRSQFYKEIFPDLELKEGKNRVSEFANNFRGEMFARGYDGAVTGVGANWIINDDPNDPIKSESPVIREATNKKFKDYSIGRRNDPKNTPVLIVQQRTHISDVTGTCLKEQLGYELHSLPVRAIADWEVRSPLTGEVLHEWKDGELLHPDRFGEEEDEEAKRSLGSFMYSSRFCQNPIPAEGIVFNANWFKICDRIGDGFMHIVSVDASFGEVSLTASNVSIQCWLLSRPDFILYDQVLRKMSFAGTVKALKKAIAKWTEELDLAPREILIEKKANGAAIIEEMGQTFNGVIPIIPRESKIARAESVAPTVEAGNVYIFDGYRDRAMFLEEVGSFPESNNDDQVDCMSQVLQRYINKWRDVQERLNRASMVRIQTYRR